MKVNIGEGMNMLNKIKTLTGMEIHETDRAIAKRIVCYFSGRSEKEFEALDPDDKIIEMYHAVCIALKWHWVSDDEKRVLVAAEIKRYSEVRERLGSDFISKLIDYHQERVNLSVDAALMMLDQKQHDVNTTKAKDKWADATVLAIKTALANSAE